MNRIQFRPGLSMLESSSFLVLGLFALGHWRTPADATVFAVLTAVVLNATSCEQLAIGGAKKLIDRMTLQKGGCFTNRRPGLASQRPSA